MRPLRTALGLVLLVVLALAARAAWVALVFPADGSVELAIADASYHARRALYSFVNFPAVLWFDPYLNFPDGSPVPWPPGYDWLLGGVARLFGRSEAVFVRVAAWAPALLGALTVLPVYAAARSLGGSGLGLGAAAIFAVLPASALVSRVGDPDHHAAVALVGATLLALALELVGRDPAPDLAGRDPAPDLAGREPRRPRGIAVGVAWASAWAALLLTWSGSLLYLALGQGLVALAGLLGGRRDLLALQSWAALLTAAVLTPVVAASQPVLGGPLSTITLSWFHVAALLGVAGVTGGVVLLEAWRPASGPLGRSLRAALLGSVLLGAFLAFPGPRQALLPSTAFLSQADGWADWALEARPLFGRPPPGVPVATTPPIHAYGLFAYLLPLAALAAWGAAREARIRAPALVFAAWATALGFLAVRQIRFGGDFAPAASIAFALLAVEASRLLTRRWPGRRRLRAAAAVLVAAGLLAPAIVAVYVPQLRFLMQRGEASNASALGPARSLSAFARAVREATPETAGFFDLGVRPEYGVLAPAGVGHAVRWGARRPVPVDNFGPYLDAARYAAVDRFFGAVDEEEAFAIARDLDARYVLTILPYAYRSAEPLRLERRLHLEDGSASLGRPGLGRFRLVAEGPPDGQPLYPTPAAASVAPYKLFERVEGALLEVQTAPGEFVRAEIALTSSAGRSFRWRTGGRSDADGRLRLRLPYSSEGTGASQAASEAAGEGGAATRSGGAWRVRVGDREQRVNVREADVREGGVIRIDV